MNRLIYRVIGLVVSTLLAAGCGGGGGSGGTDATLAFPLRAAFIDDFNRSSASNFSITGTAEGTSFSGNGRFTRGAAFATSFQSTPAFARVISYTATVTGAGETITIGETATIYVTADYRILAEEYPDEVAVVSSGGVVPETVRVNDTGIIYTATLFARPGSTQSGTSTLTYIVEPEASTSVLVKLITNDRDRFGNLDYTSVSTYRLTSGGVLMPLRETAAGDGSSLTVNYN
jgi:hypothetical protein